MQWAPELPYLLNLVGYQFVFDHSMEELGTQAVKSLDNGNFSVSELIEIRIPLSLPYYIGIGFATMIEKLEIRWPVSGKTQVFTNIKPDQKIRITEGKTFYAAVAYKAIDFRTVRSPLISCAPR